MPVSRKQQEGLRIAMVNPTTLVGKEIQILLHDRGLPYSRIELIATVGEDAGTLTAVDDEAAVVLPATDDSFQGLDLVFFTGPGEANAEWIDKRDDLGFVAIDLSQPSAVADEGVVVVAGVNLQDVREDTRLIISPHPIAIPVTLILHQLAGAVKLCATTVIQPASEFNQRGLDELLQQVIKVLNVDSFPKEIFERQLAFNIYPAAEAGETEGYATRQIRAILGPELPVSLSLLQGGVFHGHSFSMFLQTAKDLSEPDFLAALRGSDAIRVADDEEGFGTIDAGGTDQVLVGRVTKDPTMPKSFWVWAVADNLRRSSALNAVLSAEALMPHLLADA